MTQHSSVAIIRDELAAENSSRKRRGALLAIVLAGCIAGYALVSGLRPNLGEQSFLSFAVSGAFILLLVQATSGARLRWHGAAAAAIAVFAALTPLIGATSWGSASLSGWKCSAVIIGFGAAMLVAVRLVFGPVRARFGASNTLQGAAAALTGGLAVGLHCPMGTAVHLLGHVAAILIVGWGLRRLVLR